MRNCSLAHTEPGSNVSCSASRALELYRANGVVPTENSSIMVFAHKMRATTIGHGICNVSLGRSRVSVSRVTTRSVVAFVRSLHPWRHRETGYIHRNSEHRPSCRSVPEQPVPLAVPVRSPEPARAQVWAIPRDRAVLIDSRPEAIHYVLVHGCNSFRGPAPGRFQLRRGTLLV